MNQQPDLYACRVFFEHFKTYEPDQPVEQNLHILAWALLPRRHKR